MGPAIAEIVLRVSAGVSIGALLMYLIYGDIYKAVMSALICIGSVVVIGGIMIFIGCAGKDIGQAVEIVQEIIAPAIAQNPIPVIENKPVLPVITFHPEINEGSTGDSILIEDVIIETPVIDPPNIPEDMLIDCPVDTFMLPPWSTGQHTVYLTQTDKSYWFDNGACQFGWEGQ